MQSLFVNESSLFAYAVACFIAVVVIRSVVYRNKNARVMRNARCRTEFYELKTAIEGCYQLTRLEQLESDLEDFSRKHIGVEELEGFVTKLSKLLGDKRKTLAEIWSHSLKRV